MVKTKTVSLWLIVVSVTLCCTIVNNFRGTTTLQLCLLGGDFSFAAQLQETWTFVFSRPHTIGKEVGVEMRAEIEWIWESLCMIWELLGFLSPFFWHAFRIFKVRLIMILILAKDIFFHRIIYLPFRLGQTDLSVQHAWPAWLWPVCECVWRNRQKSAATSSTVVSLRDT